MLYPPEPSRWTSAPCLVRLDKDGRPTGDEKWGLYSGDKGGVTTDLSQGDVNAVLGLYR